MAACETFHDVADSCKSSFFKIDVATEAYSWVLFSGGMYSLQQSSLAH